MKLRVLISGRGYDAAEGIPIEVIDETALRYGMPMGPVELADVVGLDVCKHVGDIVSAALNKRKPDTSRLDALLAAKKLGRKSGEGFYVWKDGKAVKKPGPLAEPPPDLEDRLILALATGYIGLTLLTVAMLAFLLSVSTDAPLGAVGGAVLLHILSSILDQIEALGAIRSFLPTHFNDGWVGLLSTPIQGDTMIRGAISALSYAAIFGTLAFVKFLRKDVVS